VYDEEAALQIDNQILARRDTPMGADSIKTHL
jgi:hypothetical protein